MDIRRLRYLVAVAEERSISRHPMAAGDRARLGVALLPADTPRLPVFFDVPGAESDYR